MILTSQTLILINLTKTTSRHSAAFKFSRSEKNMNEAKFTKGPWVAYLPDDRHGIQSYDEAVVGLESYNSDPYDHFTCHRISLDGLNFDGDEVKANAHLIAAAPELYDMLASIENDAGQIPQGFWDKIQATLAKARGDL